MSDREEELQFARKLYELKDTAALQGGYLTKEQIDECFPQMSTEQMKLIYDYLEKNHIGIDQPLDSQEFMSEEDNGYLKFYLEELEEIEQYSDAKKRAITMSAISGDKMAREELIKVYLNNVVDIAKLYVGQGANMSDLIGEGNVALAMAVSMMECIESPEDADAMITRTVMNAMEEYVGMESEEEETLRKALELVDRVTDKAAEISKEYMRKVTIDELVEEGGLDREEVLETIRITDGCKEYIEVPDEAE